MLSDLQMAQMLSRLRTAQMGRRHNWCMEPLTSERRVIAAAESLAATLVGNPNHTVAAAVMDTHGRIFTAVNVFHFTGGPCAELAALGAAAAADAGPLVAVAAAGDDGRGVIPPCGRCRQVLLDLHPDVTVAVPGPEGPRIRAIHELLPDTYCHPDAQAARILRFNARYYDSVAAGTKTTTVRWRERVEEGPVILYFEDDERGPLSGEVLRTSDVALRDLTAENLRVDDADAVEEYVAGLRGHYPDMPEDAVVTVVDFALGPGGD